jgi:hypothetical protein
MEDNRTPIARQRRSRKKPGPVHVYKIGCKPICETFDGALLLPHIESETNEIPDIFASGLIRPTGNLIHADAARAKLFG